MVDPRDGRANLTRAAEWRGWRWVLLGLVVSAYLLAELPYLDRYPLLNYDEGEEMAPAYKLATQGVFGSDLMTGFYRAETRLYYMLPVYMLLMGAVFRGTFFIEGIMARLMYWSTYQMHLVALHGYLKVGLDTLSQFLRHRTAPRVKLH